MELKPAVKPAFLKIGFFGDTGTGKTYTASKVMAQFAKKYCKGQHVAFFDTEPAAGYVADMVKEITGKELLVFNSRSFSDLLDFADLCRKENHVAIVDSITHPWRSLMADYLSAKKSRLQNANQNTVRLSLKDWGPIKDMWLKFTEKYCYDPVHWCMVGREGDKWEMVDDDEGKQEMQKTGTKMKTETETGYEPALLINMKLYFDKHIAYVVKDRFDALPIGIESPANPDIDFFMPHIEKLNIGGNAVKNEKSKPIFEGGHGESYITIENRRLALLENIKDDILLVLPKVDAESKKKKVKLLRDVFDTSSWKELETNSKKFSVEYLTTCRKSLIEKLEAIAVDG